MPFDVEKHAERSMSGGIVGMAFRFCIRLLQFVMGLAVVGLYGTDLNNARLHGIYADPKWTYATVISALSAITCTIYFVPLVKSYIAFGWDALLCLFWLVVFGIFGKMYIHEDPEGDAGIQRMKNAVWIDLINFLLWLTTAIYGGVLFKRYRGMSMPSKTRSDV
ncbi:MAG: hypothetical protein M1824_003073 [Vezdaea acicularis]|nr:MAG: hypothetical protein M1824_003073 [Vezdaea acicularis]